MDTTKRMLTPTYTVFDKQLIDLVNTCVKNGALSLVLGRICETASNNRLRIRKEMHTCTRESWYEGCILQKRTARGRTKPSSDSKD